MSKKRINSCLENKVLFSSTMIFVILVLHVVNQHATCDAFHSHIDNMGCLKCFMNQLAMQILTHIDNSAHYIIIDSDYDDDDDDIVKVIVENVFW